jgi:hypothetical protein
MLPPHSLTLTTLFMGSRVEKMPRLTFKAIFLKTVSNFQNSNTSEELPEALRGNQPGN